MHAKTPAASAAHAGAEEDHAGEPRSLFSYGVSLTILALVLFFSLVKTEYGLAVTAGGTLLLILGTRLWSRLAAAHLSVSISLDADRVFPGEELKLTAHVENRKLLPVWMRLQLNTPGLLDTGGDVRLGGETYLLSRESRNRHWSLRARKRGVVSFGRVRLETGDLLGLHLRRRHISIPGELIVFPRLGKLMPLHIPFQEYFGIHASKGPVEDPAWYAGTRDYTGNRPARNIHWKASARLSKLQEKLYEPTSHRKVLLVLDTSGFPPDGGPDGGPAGERLRVDNGAAKDGSRDSRDGKEEGAGTVDLFEDLITTAATLASVLMETGASFGLVTNAALAGDRPPVLPIGRGPEQLGALLEMLARV
ncbi:MAG: DUF58 domain-containing protein, partial [Sediminispirochaetaceae bacterium]